jgi:uncharacterized protein (DUF1330 family)
MIAMFSLPLYTPEYKQYGDDVGDYVQECGGHFHIARNDVEFTVPLEQKLFVLIKFPFLKIIPLVY